MLAGSTPAPDSPLDDPDLRPCGSGYVEHLLIWSLRRIATGRVECPVMAKEFTDACGEDGQEVFATFCTFLKALGYASRRRLSLRAPGWPTLSSNERQLLNLLAAAQAGDHALFEANLCWLTRLQRRHALRIAACALSTALAANQLVLGMSQPDSGRRPACLRRASGCAR